MQHHRISKAVAFTALALLGGAAALAGCNIVVPAAYILEGPPSVDAAFELPAKRTVIFIDDTRNHLPRTALRSLMGDEIARLLLDKAVLTDVIDSSDAVQVARRYDSDQKRLSVAQVGEEVGAETVIYVKINIFALSPDGVTPRPFAEAEVKVIDVGAQKRLFPADGDGGRVVRIQTREDLEAYKTSAGRRGLEDNLAKELGREVAGLFYKHEKKELGRQLGVQS